MEVKFEDEAFAAAEEVLLLSPFFRLKGAENVVIFVLDQYYGLREAPHFLVECKHAWAVSIYGKHQIPVAHSHNGWQMQIQHGHSHIRQNRTREVFGWDEFWDTGWNEVASLVDVLVAGNFEVFQLCLESGIVIELINIHESLAWNILYGGRVLWGRILEFF